MELAELRKELRQRRGQWTAVAKAAGLSPRTVSRVVDPSWMPNTRTVERISGAIRQLDQGPRS